MDQLAALVWRACCHYLFIEEHRYDYNTVMPSNLIFLNFDKLIIQNLWLYATINVFPQKGGGGGYPAD